MQVCLGVHVMKKWHLKESGDQSLRGSAQSAKRVARKAGQSAKRLEKSEKSREGMVLEICFQNLKNPRRKELRKLRLYQLWKT